MSAKHRGLKAYEGYAEEDWMCEIIDVKREENPHHKLSKIAYDLSCDKPAPGYENPAYGLPPEWIEQRYTNRKRYDENADKLFGRIIRHLRALLFACFSANSPTR